MPRFLAALALFPSIVLAATLRIQPELAHPGDPVLVTVLGARREPTGQLGPTTLRFTPYRRGYRALVGLPVEQSPTSMPVFVSIPKSDGADAGVETLQAELPVAGPQFPTRELNVANKFIAPQPPPAVAKQLEEDRAAFAHAFDQQFAPLSLKGNFAWPRPAVITAGFGDLRTFNGQKQSQHYGTDLQGRIGDQVVAANDGVVVLARGCYMSGNTVVLFHGAGLFTLYFHLSKFDVTNGQWVKRGQVLGLVGKTGRATGPHLHWGVRVNALYVNAATLMKIDFR